MFKKWFGKKDTAQSPELTVPVKGKVIPLEEVPDPVFAEKMMGDGVAVVPEDGTLVSPIEGKVVQLFPTHHAIGIQTPQGLEVLLHIGLDTVNMKGEGFTAQVAVGDRVKSGQPLIHFSLEKVEKQAKSTVTPIVITNMELVEKLEPTYTGNVQEAGEKMLRITLK